MQEILFSILVPVYNVEKYLDECISSVLHQDYSNWELILVDDGSRDRSGEICDAYSTTDARIRIYHKENEGQLATRQYAQQQARGDYIVYLDSDDYLKINTLSVIYNTIVNYGSDCVIYGYERVNDKKVVDASGNEELRTYAEKDKRILYKKVFQDTGYNSLGRKAIRADIATSEDYSNFYHIAYGEDLLQSIEIYRECNRITFIPERLYNYRVNPASMTHSISYQNYKIDYTVREKVLEFLQLENVFTDEDYEEYRSFCVKLLESQLAMIALFRTSVDNKEKLFQKIRESKYFSEFLWNPDSKDLSCTLLHKGKFKTLMIEIITLKVIRKVKRIIHR